MNNSHIYNKPTLILMESHESSYYAWKQFNLTSKIIVHVDAHLDILPDSTQSIHYGNYLFQAIKEKIASQLYWVVPGNRDTFIRDLTTIKKIISDLYTYDLTLNTNKTQSLTYKEGRIHVQLYGIEIVICTLEDLPIIRDEVLLDIDVDYFVIDRVKNNSNITSIGERKVWIDIQNFAKRIYKSINQTQFITIAYSIIDGYTPLHYKTIGDTLASIFGYDSPSLSKRLSAGSYFSKFRTYFNKGDINEAKKNFNKAIILNPLYLVPENTYGGLFLRKRNFIKARKEFTQMLLINKSDTNCLIGLGIICIYENQLKEAWVYFRKVLKLNNANELALIYSAAIEYKRNHRSQTKILVKKIEKLNIKNYYPQYILGKVYDLENNKILAEKHYQKALQIGILKDIPMGLEVLIDE